MGMAFDLTENAAAPASTERRNNPRPGSGSNLGNRGTEVMEKSLAKSWIAKRSVRIGRHKTSVSLEDAFWQSFKEIAALKDMSVDQLVSIIDKDRQHDNLSSTIRLFVLDYYHRAAMTVKQMR
jgi:predicted DNA-binding ribbon-helix-helix protein